MINNEQNIASTPSPGPVLLLAGAGSGKTRTLVERVRRTIQEKLCLPEEIMILTFSVKAAAELKERLCKTMPEAEHSYTGTIHSFALHVITDYARDYVNEIYSGKIPMIIDGNQKEIIFKKVFLKMKHDFCGIPMHVVSSLIQKRNKHIDGVLSGELLQTLDVFYKELQREKKNCNLVDYDDLIKISSHVLDNNPGLRNEVQKRFRFIFVDEYQDISGDLFNLLKLLAGTDGNIFVVGDDYQSIYGFRDANISYILESRKYFPDGKILNLESNYRSNKEITDLGKCIINKNRFRTKKKTKSESGKGGHVSSYPSLSDMEDVRIIKRVVSDYSSDSTSIAILCRTNSQIETIKSHFQKIYQGIPSGLKLMTIHASKGLEFDTIIIAGIESRIFPSCRSDVEEERRIFYVGITRAKSRLVLVFRYGKQGIPQFIRETVLSPSWLIRHPFWVIRDYSRILFLKIRSYDKQKDHLIGTGDPFSSSIV